MLRLKHQTALLYIVRLRFTMVLRLHQCDVAVENEGGVHRRQTCDKKMYVSASIFLWKEEAFSWKLLQFFVFNLNTSGKKFFTCESFDGKICAAFYCWILSATIFHGDSENLWSKSTFAHCFTAANCNFLIGFFINWSSLINYITCRSYIENFMGELLSAVDAVCHEFFSHQVLPRISFMFSSFNT